MRVTTPVVAGWIRGLATRHVRTRREMSGGTPPSGGMVRDVPLYATDDEILVTTNVGTFRIDPNTLPIADPGMP